VTILALGLGAATSMFSILDAVLLRPLPFPESERLVRIHRTMAGDSSDSIDRSHSPGDYFAYRAGTDLFEGVAAVAMSDTRVEINPDQPPEMMWGASVSADYFPVFRVGPRLGRLFMPEEYERGRDNVVLLSTQLWQSRFGGDPGIVGHRIRIGGEPLLVVGVMPPELHDPIRFWGRGLFWRPLSFWPGAQNDHQMYWLRLFGRLKPGVSMARAQAGVNLIAARLDTDFQTRSGARLVAPQKTGALDLAGNRVTWLSMGLGVFVLLIACINLAGVQLARLGGRGHDLAVRVALGAGRGRLVREMLTESVLLSFIGGAVSILVAHWCTAFLASRITVGWRRVTIGVPAHLDGRVLGFSFVLVLVTAVVVGTLPAWLSARGVVAQALRQGGHGAGGRSSGWRRLRQALVVAEMALALVLLAAGGLFLRGLHRFGDRDPGWGVDRLMTARVNLPGPRHRGEPGGVFLEGLQQRLAGLPGVEVAALSAALPLWENGWGTQDLWVQGTPVPRPGEGPSAYGNSVTPDYFRALGLSLREGRVFTAADRQNPDRVLIINETMARSLWPGQSAIGKRLGDPRGDPARPPQWATVVGVVSDARFVATLTAPVSAYQIYDVMRSPGSAMVLLRTRGAPEAAASDLRRVLAGLDSEVSVDDVLTARALANRALGNFSLLAWTLFAFAALGLVLSALGVYGLFAGYVVQHTREIGVRMALGAQTGQVLRMVLGKGLQLALLGGVLGVAGAMAVVPLLGSVAAELPARDPTAIVVLAMSLIAVALFACWLPARRAARLDPMVALRSE